ncbi:primosomal protein N' [Endozoicomonas sp. SM1973]|uniref:Replication restart protein PriA n=1 Tax=Spartinivicinus marinus TaxID=2994442 RepID=A0A853IAI3_9GAMM|nr:primosomal protein N' [Spartinivicinus marinus]MCX4026479.1 primosomal protein N' [Spartinivicinus marinus]NYZ66851.1 primosomal protein N' [Spartinivicinus marinus]
MSQPDSQAPTTYLQVALPVPFRRLFDYHTPHRWNGQPLQPGIRVKVSFGNRQLIGVLISTTHQSDWPANKLKPVLELIDEQPLIPPELLKLCQWTAKYYHHSLGETLQVALPAVLRQGKTAGYGTATKYSAAAADQDQTIALSRAPKQLAAYKALLEHPSGLTLAGLKGLGIASHIIQGLRQKQLIIAVEAREPATAKPWPNSLLRQPALSLNPAQQQAVTKVSQLLGQFCCFLLQGVTGSGKTEVYLQIIEACLKQKRQALVLIPEIGLTPQTLQRFQARFSVPIATLHSNLTDLERWQAWQAAASGQAGIVIGTRSAIFTPLAKPGVIIIDEEHDGSFKQQDNLRYSARDVAVYRANQLQTPIVLGSATPALESLYNAAMGRYQKLELPDRAGDAKPPAINMLDLKGKPLSDGLALDLQPLIASHLTKGNQVLVFINRRGFAPTLICHECGWLSDCSHCDAHLTLHRYPPLLRCHHCGIEESIPTLCPQCQQNSLHPVGTGTERCEATLSQWFPETELVRIDRDTTQRKNAMQELLEKIHQEKPAILLGTQMLAKGHHFPKVSLVVVVDADSGLFSADFRGVEKLAQLLTQVAGRAGRAATEGEVIIQTHQPDHKMLQRLQAGLYGELTQSLLKERQGLSLPPFGYMVLLRAESPHQQKAEALLNEACQEVQQTEVTASLLSSVEVLGPLPAPMEKRQGRFRYQLVLHARQRQPLHQLTHMLIQCLENNKLSRQVRWSVDVDPQDMG